MTSFVNNFFEKNPFEEPPANVAGFESITESDKSFYERVFACGASHFSDGYLNGVRNIIDLKTRFPRPKVPS